MFDCFSIHFPLTLPTLQLSKQNHFMAIKTLDTTTLSEETGNLYETVVVLSKRARQVASARREDLSRRLSAFDELSLDPAEEIRSNEDQLRISVEFEKMEKPSEVAIDELAQDQLYFRRPSLEEENALEG